MNKDLYLSYSRAYKFITDKKGFVDKYVFGIEEPESASRRDLKKFHLLFQEFCKFETIEQALKNHPKYITENCENWAKPNTKTRKELESKGHIFIKPSELASIQSHLFQLTLKPFADVREILIDSVSEEMIYDDQQKFRGRCDFFAQNKGIVELKSQSELSFKLMKFRYALQQVFYTLMLRNFNFYFLLAPQSYPYELNFIDIDYEYLAAVEKHLEEVVVNEYFKFIDLALKFDPKIFQWKDIVSKGMDGCETKTGPTTQQKREFMNYLYSHKFLDPVKLIIINEWEINKLLKGEI